MALTRPDPGRIRHDEQGRAGDAAAATYRLIADTIPHIVWVTSAAGELEFLNRPGLEYLGLDPAGLAAWDWRRAVHADDLEKCASTWARALQTGERLEHEYRIRRADGAFRWHRSIGVPVRGRDGRIERWFGSSTDIEGEVATESRFRLFMDNLPAHAWAIDAAGRYTYVNARYAAAFGCDPADMIGRDLSSYFPPTVVERFREMDREVKRAGVALQYVDEDPGGSKLLKVKFPVADAGIGGIALDITERLRLEEALAETERRHRASLMQAQEQERKRVADSLHDLIGQNLTALGIELAALKARLPAAELERAAPRLDAMTGLLNDTIESIRGVMTELRPPALDEYGLVPAVRWYARLFGERTGIQASTSVSMPETRLPREAELALFRILQEALTNAAKHSGAASVEIALTGYRGGVRLSIEDDGRGFDGRGRPGGWGLSSMRERAELHGGRLRIEFPGRGTRVVAEVPGGG